MSFFLTLLAALAALHAHGLLRIGPRLGFKFALRAFVAGALATAAAQALGARGALTPVLPALVVLGAIAALVAWAGLIRLVSFETRRRDIVGRALTLGLAALAAAFSSSIALAATLALSGVLTWRWKRELHTRARFSLGIGAIAVSTLLLLHTGHTLEPGALPKSLEALHRFTRTVLIVSAWYALLGAVALLRAWAQDPSLGIRRVSRRLALSHTFVGLVPLLLALAMWTITTVLGVLNERAIVGARAIEALGRGYQAQLAAAVSEPDGARERLAALPRAIDPGSSIGVWQRQSGRIERLAGADVAAPRWIGEWLDSLATLPRDGVVGLVDSAYIGVAAAGPGGEAVLLMPIRDALASLPDSVARARISVMAQAFIGRGGDNSVEVGSPDSTAAALGSLADSLDAGRATTDSAETARLRRTLRRFGVRDSGLTIQSREQQLAPGISIGGKRVSDPSGNFLLEGHALARGLHWGPSRGWESGAYMVTARAPWREVLGGLATDVRTNPLAWIPISLIALFLIAAVVIVMIDLQMVSGMAGSITRAVGALDGAAARLRAGDLSHRIPIAGEDDLWRVAAAFNTATDGLQRAREAEKEQERIENELDVARRIQARLLPAAPPRVQGLEVAGLYDPAREVGGDYYDHIALDEHRALLVIADVSGKSVPAALIMAGFRAALVSQDLPTCGPDTLAERLNGFLNDSLDPGKFVTAFLAVIDGRTGHVAYVNAGHNPPVLRRADGRHEMLVDGGTILGIMRTSRYERGASTLEPGDVLVLYTDGVPEGMSPDHQLWGDERLIAAVGAHADESCAMLVRSIAGTVRAFEGERGPADDVTLIAVRRAAG